MENTNQQNANTLSSLFARGISNNFTLDEIKVISNILIPKTVLSAQKAKNKIEDKVLDWLESMGFYANRTRNNLNGYPTLISSLFEPPPWIDVEIEDTSQDLPPQRLMELRPLHEHFATEGYNLIEKYRKRLIEDSLLTQRYLNNSDTPDNTSIRPGRIYEHLIEREINEFQKKLSLLNLLTTEELFNLYDSITGDPDDIFPESTEQPGAPDLFVWHPDSTKKIWFFAEVKSQTDSLQTSQSTWIESYWDTINGKILIIKIV